ncbi:MAG: DUF6498-containing protein, partial [Pseudomonadota bacterium]
LLPIYAVFAFGWGAAPLVLLYWLENLIIGAVTLLRMLVRGASGGAVGAAGALFTGAFFTVHFGLFCFVHGTFLTYFAAMSEGREPEGFPTPMSLIGDALAIAPGVMPIAAALLAWHVLSAVQDMRAGETDDVHTIMSSPYGRIIVLHFGLFIGFGAMAVLGDPLLGVLGLILLDVAWGVFLTVRRSRQDREDPPIAQQES